VAATCVAEHGIAEACITSGGIGCSRAAKAALATSRDRSGDPSQAELRDAKRRIGQLERALDKKTYELEVVGNCRGTGRERPGVQGPRGGCYRTSSHDGDTVADISRQAIYRPLTRRGAIGGTRRCRCR
jgi:hypothetical protein